MRQNLNRIRRRRRGVEAIEFAMVLVFFPAIVMGMLEFGRAFEVSQWLTAAAREGARLGMLYNVITDRERNLGVTAGTVGPPITEANEKVKKDVQNFLRAARVPADAVQVYITTPDGSPVDGAGNPQTPPEFDLDNYSTSAGNYFKVLVTVPFEEVSYLTPTYLSGATLSGQIIVRHE